MKLKLLISLLTLMSTLNASATTIVLNNLNDDSYLRLTINYQGASKLETIRIQAAPAELQEATQLPPGTYTVVKIEKVGHGEVLLASHTLEMPVKLKLRQKDRIQFDASLKDNEAYEIGVSLPEDYKD